MGGVPSVPTDPNRTLEVIGAGFARTGTVSMALALEKILDGPVCHGGTQLLGREDGETCPTRTHGSADLQRQLTFGNGSPCTRLNTTDQDS
jgi:Sulfotransferase domain